MPDTQNQIKTLLVLWLLFSTGNNIDKATWDEKIKPHLTGPGALPAGSTPDSLLADAQKKAVPLSHAVGAFKTTTESVNTLWGGGTSCPSLETIISMFPQ